MENTWLRNNTYGCRCNHKIQRRTWMVIQQTWCWPTNVGGVNPPRSEIIWDGLPEATGWLPPQQQLCHRHIGCEHGTHQRCALLHPSAVQHAFHVRFAELLGPFLEDGGQTVSGGVGSKAKPIHHVSTVLSHSSQIRMGKQGVHHLKLSKICCVNQQIRFSQCYHLLIGQVMKALSFQKFGQLLWRIQQPLMQRHWRPLGWPLWHGRLSFGRCHCHSSNLSCFEPRRLCKKDNEQKKSRDFRSVDGYRLAWKLIFDIW